MDNASTDNINELLKECNAFMEEKRDILHSGATRLNIHDFDRYFRRWWKNEVPVSDNEAFSQAWFAVAKSSTAPVYIVDDADEVIIKVPPIHDTSMIRPSQNVLRELYGRKELLDRNLPGLASKRLNEALSEYSDDIVVDTDTPQEWEKFRVWVMGDDTDSVADINKHEADYDELFE